MVQELLEQTNQFQEDTLPDFSREILDSEGVEKAVAQAIQNRELLLVRATEFGLSRDFLQNQPEFAIGPFVNPAPIPTTFAGKAGNFRCSVETGAQIKREFERRGYKAAQFLAIPLSMTEIPIKGSEAMDCLVLPKSKDTNQRVSFVNKQQKGKVYSSVRISRDDLQIGKTLTDTFNQYTQKYPQLKRGGKGKIIPESIVEDLQGAYLEAEGQDISSSGVRYLEFVSALNAKIAKRVNPDISLPSNMCVDLAYYSPFLKYGIEDVVRFVRKLEAVRFPLFDAGFVKIVDAQNLSQVLKIAEVKEDDLVLKFKDKDATVLFSELQSSDTDIAPCKELSYLLCFSNIFPVVYGSQNAGGYYEPYARTREQVKRLGFNPVLYRTQPQIPGSYEDIGTIFDFYKEVLFSDGID